MEQASATAGEVIPEHTNEDTDKGKKGTKDGEQLQFFPCDNWGLDYYFSVYSKMYVRDILDMNEYPMFPGAFCYKNHPIYKVDVLGVIVKAEEKAKFHLYAVDDSTGMISCLIWKRNFNDKDGSYMAFENDLKSLPDVLKRKGQELLDVAKNDTTVYCLGDLLHVKGKLKVYRDTKEIIAAHHKAATDPMCEVLRMSELPKLYTMCYDRPFQLPYKVAQELALSKQEEQTGLKSQERVCHEMKGHVMDHFRQTSIVEVIPSDILKLKKVQQLLAQVQDASQADKLGMVFQTLCLLEEDGQVCKRSDARHLFEVLCNKSKLESTIVQILKKEGSKPQYSEKGVHYLRVCDELQKTLQYAKVRKNAVIFVLQKLESQSDVIRTTQSHYIVCND